MSFTIDNAGTQLSLGSMFTIQKSEVSEVQMSLEACAPEAEQDCAARPLTLFARADGDAGPCPEEASDVAHEETAVQAGTLPDPISGPRETGMAQASSSSGSLIPAWIFSHTCSVHRLGLVHHNYRNQSSSS